MAPHMSTAGDVANKKTKGLKDHKKGQKEKTLAKRTAAAEKVRKEKNLSASATVDVDKEVAPAQEEAAGIVETAPIAMTTAEIFAHRKTLEAALYNMETPRQMLIRCEYRMPIDAEYHPDDAEEVALEADCSYDYVVDDSKSAVKCLDDNRFEIEPIMTGLTIDDMTTRTDITPCLTLHRLFAMVENAGHAKVGTSNALSNPLVSHTLESVEAEMAEMRLAANDAFVDPAIISCKVKQLIFDKADEYVVVADPLVGDGSEEFSMLSSPLSPIFSSPPIMSPSSSHYSSIPSPVDPQRAHTPLTYYTATPPPGFPVWSIPYVPYSGYGYSNGPGFPMKPYIGGFQTPLEQRHPAWYGYWSTAGDWMGIPLGWPAPYYAQ
jgi:hypothetical protein